MKREDVRRLQLAQFNLLKWFDKKCHELNLTYYLVYGSLLGAIRHGGSIPWDADIDVAMHRRDYECFKEYMIKNPDAHVFFDHYLTDKNLYAYHAILRINGTRVIYNSDREKRYKSIHNGIFIDVFPLDELPTSETDKKALYRKLLFYERLLSMRMGVQYPTDSSVKKSIKKALSVVLSAIPLKIINISRDKVIQSFNGTHSPYLSTIGETHFFYKLYFNKELFGKPSVVSFEQDVFLAPTSPKTFLEISYGDYMSFPPEETRWNYLDNVMTDVDFGEIVDFREFLGV